MALPELIEMVPLEKPVVAEITVPGSKSITNRALILAALAKGEITLRGALWSEDTQVMVDSLQRLGFSVRAEPDANEPCNRTLVVGGLDGKIPNAGTAGKPLELFVGNAGTAARFLAALVCLGRGVYRLQGTTRMNERPQAGLFNALRQLGYRVDSENNRLPADILEPDRGWDHFVMWILREVPQHASALMLSSLAGGWHVDVNGQDLEEDPYVRMTRLLEFFFPRQGGEFQVEPDASSASYFWAAQWMSARNSSITVASCAPSYWSGSADSSNSPTQAGSSGGGSRFGQIDAAFPDFFPLPAKISRRTQLGDSIMTAMILAPFADAPVTFTDLERLRVQECERVVAMRTELTKCGVKVLEEGDSLTIFPCQGPGKRRFSVSEDGRDWPAFSPSNAPHGAEIATYNDHRMAMCFAILGLKVPGIRIQNPACVKKTFPNFFQKLAAAPPGGLGAIIIDVITGRRLGAEELFAG